MRQTKYYKIADFVFSLELPDGVDTATMLPSFRTFGTCRAEDLLFRFKVNAEVLERPSGLELIEKTESDVGKVSMYRTAAGDWWLEMSYTDIDYYMSVTEDFSSASADIDLDDPDAGMVLCSMLRIMWSQAVLALGGISVHASAVVCDGKAYLFLGKSGTGKSTHSELWLRNFREAWLLNDDNPAIRLIDGKAFAYGTPWSGKKPVYIDKKVPLGGIVRLQQAPENSMTLKEGLDAFLCIYPSCSALHRDPVQENRLCDTLEILSESVPVGLMECRPDDKAAIICHETILKDNPVVSGTSEAADTQT